MFPRFPDGPVRQPSLFTDEQVTLPAAAVVPAYAMAMSRGSILQTEGGNAEYGGARDSKGWREAGCLNPLSITEQGSGC